MNSYSITDVANIALSHLMDGQAIGDVTSEQSPHANAMRVYLPIAIGTTLRDFAWPFATQYASLALVTTYPSSQVTNTPGFNYAYRKPADCVTIRRINSGLRMDNLYTRIPFKEMNDPSGGLILTDMPNAYAEYTQYVDNPGYWPDDFVMAISFKLAMLAAPRITGGDPFKLGDKSAQNYVEWMSVAQANALNEEEPGMPLDSELTLVREQGFTTW